MALSCKVSIWFVQCGHIFYARLFLVFYCCCSTFVTVFCISVHIDDHLSNLLSYFSLRQRRSVLHVSEVSERKVMHTP